MDHEYHNQGKTPEDCDAPACPSADPPPPPPKARKGMDLTEGAISKVLIVFSLPIVLQMSIQPVYGIIDSVFIARLGPDSFTAVTNAGTIQMLVILLAAGLANGVTSYVSRLVGAGKLEEADNAATHSMIMMIVFSFAIMAVFVPLGPSFMEFLGLERALVPEAEDYIDVILYGNISIMFFLIGSNILRGEGDANTPLVIALFSVGLNVVLDPILIFGPEDEVFGYRIGWFGLGVYGGALATVISRVLGCLLLVWYLKRGGHVWTFTLRNYSFTPKHFAEVLRVGFPMLLVNLSAWAASLVFLRVLNPYDGAVVAWGMGTKLDHLAILPAIGLMLGVVSMVGQNYGAGRIGRVKRTALVGGFYAAGFALVSALVYLVFPGFWVSLFNKTGDPVIRELGVGFIHIVAITYIFVAQAFVLGGVFQGLGKGMQPLAITVTRFIVVAIPLALVLPPRIGPMGAWWAIAASHVVGGLMAVAWLLLELRGLGDEKSGD